MTGVGVLLFQGVFRGGAPDPLGCDDFGHVLVSSLNSFRGGGSLAFSPFTVATRLPCGARSFPLLLMTYGM
ncbi:hypothetical protein D8I24_8251 [Cupriavidus necator H850]|nr:hypothetical protein D8I24_8251 [Cupriavidus necator H850]